mmetsp:Transcript_12875/g.43019  ORF Transcript_12875/g.43019 Transcript_12875/m.43019 type:complete len:204 (-) Transcript_12875:1335-1946(-)
MHELVGKGPRLARLLRHELALALLRNLQKRVAGHVLDARVQLVHKLKELVHHRLQELPVRAQEARVLADDVHNVRRDARLVILASFHLAQAQQVLDHGDEEALLLVFRHGAGDGADGPAQSVQVGPGPLRAVHLQRQLVQHYRLRVVVVQVRQVDERLAHRLVLRNGLGVLCHLAHNLAVLVLDDQNLLGLGHARDHDEAHLR